jgi:hypothetical protein
MIQYSSGPGKNTGSLGSDLSFWSGLPGFHASGYLAHLFQRRALVYQFGPNACSHSGSGVVKSVTTIISTTAAKAKVSGLI